MPFDKDQAAAQIAAIVATREDGLAALRWYVAYHEAQDMVESHTTKDFAHMLLSPPEPIASDLIGLTEAILWPFVEDEDEDVSFDEIAADIAHWVAGYTS